LTQKEAKIALDRICSPATILFVDFSSFIKIFQPNPYPSGVNDEKGVPQNGQVKPPKGFGFPLGGAFRFRPYLKQAF
jgi:hypothetical protein